MGAWGVYATDGTFGAVRICHTRSKTEAIEAASDWNAASRDAIPGLYDYSTDVWVRPATAAELQASLDAAENDGGAGAITTDDVARAYVV
jgi:hypothetical protein